MYGKNLKSKTAKGSGKEMAKVVADNPLNNLGSSKNKIPKPQYQSKTPIAKRGGGKRISKGGSF